MTHQEHKVISATSGAQKHSGSCHCGTVKFEVTADLSQGASRCNCSVCTKISQLGVTVKPDTFQLLSGEAALSSYEWGQKVGKRFFCKHCGVHCFGKGHLEQIGGDYVSVNVNALDDVDPSLLRTTYWDGRHDNWMAGTREKPWPIWA